MTLFFVSLHFNFVTFVANRELLAARFSLPIQRTDDFNRHCPDEIELSPIGSGAVDQSSQ
jgi:hypothetical protein